MGFIFFIMKTKNMSDGNKDLKSENNLSSESNVGDVIYHLLSYSVKVLGALLDFTNSKILVNKDSYDELYKKYKKYKKMRKEGTNGKKKIY